MQRSVDHSRDVALHEARHAAYAAYAGLDVVGVRVGAWQGCTDVRLPVEVYGVQHDWDADPRMALHHMRALVGSLIAPVAAEGKLFRANTDDSALLGAYARAWTRLRPSRATGEHAPAWLNVLAGVRREVRAWAGALGAAVAIRELAFWLAREGEVDASGWAWLWRQSFAQPLHPRTAPPVAGHGRMVPAGAAKPKITGLDIQFQWCLEDAENLRRSVMHAQDHRPNGPYRPLIRYAA